VIISLGISILVLSTLHYVHGFISCPTLPTATKDFRHYLLTPKPPPLPTPPLIDIDSDLLLSQSFASLTIKELKDLLRQHNEKVSGNKKELVARLGSILSCTKDDIPLEECLISDIQPILIEDEEKHSLLDTYSNMTLKELKNLLRQKGAKVSGNKAELVDRLIEIQVAVTESPKSDVKDEEWSILQPSISLDNQKLEDTSREDIELPCLSGLMFINKPAGYSTLPTKQQLDNPSQPPEYPCLSDSVKNWLYNNPDGRDRIKAAHREEDKWWKFMLQSVSNDKRKLKKMQKRREKLKTKMDTFEPRPVHRLDIDTSGIVCIALTPYSLRAANMLFERKSRIDLDNLDTQDECEIVQKQYVALVERGSETIPQAGVIKHPIGKVWVEDHNEWACDVSGNGTLPLIRPNQDNAIMSFAPDSLREAVTSYRVDETELNATRVLLRPHTGRKVRVSIVLSCDILCSI